MLAPAMRAILLAPLVATQGTAAPTCTVGEAATWPVSIRGREIYVEPSSLTHSPNGVLVMGEPVLLTNPTERALVNGRAAVGVLVGPNGRTALVPGPSGTSGIRNPRVVYEPKRGWHVFWLPELTSLAAHPDSATLTYARFDGRQWTPPEKLGSVGTILTGPAGMSQPVLAGGRVVIAMVDGRTMLDRRIVLFASRGRGGWDRRAVEGIVPTSYTTLAGDDKQLVLAYTGRDSALNPGLFATRSRDRGATWSPPGIIVGASASQPTVIARDDALVTAWQDFGAVQAGTEIRFAQSADWGRGWSKPVDAGKGSIATDYSLTSLGIKGFLMLRQTRDSGAAVKTAIGWGRDSVIHWRDVDSAPESFLPVIAAGTDGQSAYVAWGEIVGKNGKSLPRLVLRKIRISCSRGS